MFLILSVGYIQPPALANAVPILSAGPDDWCGGHGLPESKCTICNPELIPQFKAAGDWCAGHELPESVCPTCNPKETPSDAAPPPFDWCAGHDVPESKCTLCNPELIPKFKTSGDWCAEHELPESVCPICNPGALPPEAIEARIVRFISEELEARAGIRTEPAQRGPASETVQAGAQFAFHADRVADLRAVIPGVVRQIHAELGAQVTRGAPLFDLESVRVGDTQAHLRKAIERGRLAETNLKRLQRLNERGMATARELELAEQELESARAETDSARTELRMTGASTEDNTGRFTLTAPIDGTLVRRPAMIGTLATEETSLGMIADTRVMWALCDVPEQDAGRLALDAPVRLTLGNGETHEGRITWISAEVDPRTRTVKVRAEVANPDGRLRANQFAQARIETAFAPDALLVPGNAVQRVGALDVVFVRREPGIYEPRVVTAFAAGKKMRVEGRLQPGEPVVTTGAVLLRTEVLPGSIGAGCCEVEPLGGN
ncbi:MAG: efflux RND transporter periplasmic adaptor subunit [Acidobacteriota bacterium]|nr:efflux RND transporter periplasmic adaptor subunit [Acidobacteriota bacterium]